MTGERIRLTPTEDLVMEVLAARHRLGEHLWTFEARHRLTLDRLCGLGLVNVMPGIVQGTVRASLTDAGRAECLSPDYQPPAPATSHVSCSRCGKPVSNDVPGELVVRAFVECPECVLADQEQAAAQATAAQPTGKFAEVEDDCGRVWFRDPQGTWRRADRPGMAAESWEALHEAEVLAAVMRDRIGRPGKSTWLDIARDVLADVSRAHGCTVRP